MIIKIVTLKGDSFQALGIASVWLGGSYLNSLNLSFPICKMKTKTVSFLAGAMTNYLTMIISHTRSRIMLRLVGRRMFMHIH